MTIWDRLAILEGACEHEWDDKHLLGMSDEAIARTVRWVCGKCGASCCDVLPQTRTKRCHHGDADLPLVGDGRNEEKYNSVETVGKAANRLGLYWCVGQNAVSGDYFGQVYGEVPVLSERGDSPQEALAHAIARAYPPGVDEIPEEGKEVSADE